MRKDLKIFLIVASDIFIFYFSLTAALFIRYAIISRDLLTFYNSASLHFVSFTIIFAVWLIVFWAAGLYDLSNLKNEKLFYKNFFVTFGANAAIAVSFFYFIPYFVITPKVILFIDLILVFTILYFWRLYINRFFSEALKTGVVFVGASPEVSELKDFLSENPQLGYSVAGILAPDNATELEYLWQMKKFSLIVSTERFDRTKKLAYMLFNYFKKGVVISDLNKFYENVTDRVPISTIREVWFLENIGRPQKRIYDITKRFADILGSIVLAVITLAMLPFVATAIEISYPGTIFYKQQRVGRGGKIFTLIKFRTLISGASARETGGIYKESSTTIGRFLRKTHIDELPQVWNVLSGQMSFIGPRPEKPEFVKNLSEEISFYEMRHLVKPGITGWAQLHNPGAGPTVDETTEKLQYDLYYVKNRSAFLDLSIALKTLKLLFTGAGK